MACHVRLRTINQGKIFHQNMSALEIPSKTIKGLCAVACYRLLRSEGWYGVLIIIGRVYELPIGIAFLILCQYHIDFEVYKSNLDIDNIKPAPVYPALGVSNSQDYAEPTQLSFKRNPAPDGHRCGVCPTYLQKICAFDYLTNATFIFDNHCVMDIYNCIEGTEFAPLKYDKCLYFGNFAYVHGFKYEDMDYGEDHIVIKGSKKNPDFVRRLF